jgi:hypothetical protein
MTGDTYGRVYSGSLMTKRDDKNRTEILAPEIYFTKK